MAGQCARASERDRTRCDRNDRPHASDAERGSPRPSSRIVSSYARASRAGAHRGDLAGSELGARRLGRRGSEARVMQNDAHLQDAGHLGWERPPQVSEPASTLAVAKRTRSTTAGRWLIERRVQSRLPSDTQSPLVSLGRTFLRGTGEAIEPVENAYPVKPAVAKTPTSSASSRAPAIQPVQRSISRMALSGRTSPMTRSAICTRPPASAHARSRGQRCFVGHETEHAVRDDDIDCRVLDREVHRIAVPDVDVPEAATLSTRHRPLAHGDFTSGATYAEGRR
jgi:hypothetical protein